MNNDTPAPDAPTPAPPAFQPSSAPEPPTPPVVDTPPPTNPPSKSGNTWKEFGTFVGILAVAVGVAFLLISFVFRSYEVDGPSMESTLQNQDKLIIWKVPRTWSRITGHQYVPKRGDIIIFDQSNLAPCGQEGTRQLIKRVIGLPGDHVTVKNDHYVIYDKQHPNGFDPDATLAYDKDGHIPQTTGDVNVTLSSSQLFVSGDNRPDSCDSRAFGPIGTNQVIGKLVLRILPANEIELF